MYELIQASDRCFYIESPNKVGIVKISDNDVVIIDAGGDKDAGKKVLRILNEHGWNLSAVYATHHHADHIGGCKYLQDQTGCKVYVYGTDCDLAKHTELEPTFIYGALPLPGMCTKFLVAPQCRPEPLTESVLPEGFELIHLPGHTVDMVGFRIDGEVCYVGDSVASGETLAKYAVSYLYDVQGFIDSIEKVRALEGKCFIPTHAAAVSDITELCDINLSAVYSTGDMICDILKEPMTFENMLKTLFIRYGLHMTVQQYLLVGSTVRSYLTWLYNSERVEYEFIDSEMIWKAKQN